MGTAQRPWGPAEIRAGTNRPVVVGQAPTSGAVLGHPSVSGRHAEVKMVAGRLVVADLGSRFGTFVNGERIEVRTVDVGTCVAFGAVRYTFADGALRLLPLPDGVGIRAVGLAADRGGRRVLAGVDLTILPGQFVGLIGPSGSGKSTLLKCLAGVITPTAGLLVADERLRLPAQAEEYRTVVGYVPQDDVVHPLLTAREAFDYSLRLRKGRDAADGRAGLVTATLDRLRLTAHAGRPAGTLSGGLRKRVNVGLELLVRPRGLFLDEPTAGLDPGLAARLMRFLKGLASKDGVTVVCVTHLPGDVALFDQVIVVAGGTVAYAGPPRPMLARFGTSSFPKLFERLDNLSGPVEQPRPPTSPPRHIATELDRKDRHDERTSPLVQRIPWVTQVMVMAARGVRVITRDRTLLALLAGQPLVIGLLINLSQVRPASLAPLFLFAAVAAIWFGLNNAAREVVRDRRSYVREHLIGVTAEGYLAAKALLLGGIGVMQVSLLGAVVKYVNALPAVDRRELDGYPMTYVVAVLLIAYLSGMALGLLVSTVADTEEAAVAALPLIVLPQLLLTGVATGLDADAGRSGAFRPLVELVLNSGADARGITWLVELAALPTYSRPAAALLRPQSEGPGLPSAALVACVDWLHAILLLTATAAVLLAAFRRREREWLERA